MLIYRFLQKSFHKHPQNPQNQSWISFSIAWRLRESRRCGWEGYFCLKLCNPITERFLGSSTCWVFTSSFSTAGSHLRLKCQTSGSIHFFHRGDNRTQRFGSDKNVGICETTSRQLIWNTYQLSKVSKLPIHTINPTNPCLKQLSS